MGSRAFPAGLVPTRRSYSPGAYPQTVFQAANGATTVVRFGNRRVDAELQLGFDNIDDARAVELLALYETTQATGDWINMSSDNAPSGADLALRLYFTESGGSGLRWRFAEPPQVESVFPGISSVQCRLVARLDAG